MVFKHEAVQIKLKNYPETVKYPCWLCPTANTTARFQPETAPKTAINSHQIIDGVARAWHWQQTISWRLSRSHSYHAVILSIQTKDERSWPSSQRVRDFENEVFEVPLSKNGMFALVMLKSHKFVPKSYIHIIWTPRVSDRIMHSKSPITLW